MIQLFARSAASEGGWSQRPGGGPGGSISTCGGHHDHHLRIGKCGFKTLNRLYFNCLLNTESPFPASQDLVSNVDLLASSWRSAATAEYLCQMPPRSMQHSIATYVYPNVIQAAAPILLDQHEDTKTSRRGIGLKSRKL